MANNAPGEQPAESGGQGGPANNGGGGGAHDTASGQEDWLGRQLRAVNWSLLILLIFAGVILVAIFQDSQVLRRLEDPAYARGVITFLISLAAIGLAFMFVYQAFSDNATSEDGFRRGREVLSGLMGVLGTIVGFYFGSTEKGGAHLDLAAKQEGTNLVAHASGGTPPYRGTLFFEPKDVKAVDNLQSSDGWIVVSLSQAAKATKATLEVEDAKDVKSSAIVVLKAPTAAPEPDAGSKDHSPEQTAAPTPGATPQ